MRMERTQQKPDYFIKCFHCGEDSEIGQLHTPLETLNTVWFLLKVIKSSLKPLLRPDLAKFDETKKQPS